MHAVDSCPLCQHTSFAPFQTVDDQGHDIHYVICKNCGLVLQSPRMNESELDEFYASAYRVHQHATEDPIEKDLRMQQARAEYTLTLVRDDIKEVRRHMDIGSSSGAFLRAVEVQYQCIGIGIEPGDAYREYSRTRGNHIHPSHEKLNEANEERFDLISMMHVLEHLPDPITTLDQLRNDLLAPDGHLLIEVPNLFEHASFELAHLYAFSPQTLREVLRQAGYKILWLRTHGGFRSPILKLYITVLAVPLAKAKVPHKIYLPGAFGVGLRRRLGTIKRNFLTKHLPDWTWQSPS